MIINISFEWTCITNTYCMIVVVVVVVVVVGNEDDNYDNESAITGVVTTLAFIYPCHSYLPQLPSLVLFLFSF